MEANGYFCIQKANEEVAILGQKVCVIPSAFFHQITLMLQTVYSQAAFALFMHSEASKSFSIDLTNASLIECLTAKINFKARLFPHYPKSHQCLLSYIRLIEQELDCVILPTQVGDVFYSFFISRLLDRGVKPSSIRTLCYQLRSCLEWSAKHRAKISDTYAEFTVPDYRRPTIALTPDEVSMIYHLNLQPLVKRKDHRALLEKAKDIFVLSCNLGQRHSDMLRIQKKNFDRNIFTIVQQKTGHRAVVDIDKFAIDKKTTYEILEKYNYTAPYKATIGCYNSKIHELMKLAGLTEDVLLETKIQDEIKEEIFPKYKLIASHTARRTFISANVFRGIPEYRIRKASGHTDCRSFAMYICENID